MNEPSSFRMAVLGSESDGLCVPSIEGRKRHGFNR